MTVASVQTFSVQQIEQKMTASIGESRYSRYFRDDTRFDVSSDTLRIRVKERFYAEWIGNKFGDQLRSAAREATGNERADVDIVVDPEVFGVESDETAESSAPAIEQAVDRPARVTTPMRSRNPRWKNPPLKGTLDDFIVGTCNRLAYQAAQRVAKGDRSVDFSMLFLHGECGVGKTHLLQGIVNGFRRNKPGARVRYVTGEAFTNRYISAIRKGRMSQFRDAYRDLDLLCIDDIHFISGKDSTQSECLHTLDDLDLQGARIVLASDEHPRRIAKLDHRLMSRLLSGMIVGVDRPDEQTRRRMIQRITSSRALSLEPAALGLLAERCEGSARDIIGAVTRIEALIKLMPETVRPGGEISPAIIHRALGEVSMSRPTRPIKVAEIARTVCAELLVDLSDVLGPSRHKRVVLARSATAHLSRLLTTQSFPEIATQLSRTNHSTIVTACQRVERQMAAGEHVDDPRTGERTPLAEIIERLRAAVLRESSRMSNA